MMPVTMINAFGVWDIAGMVPDRKPSTGQTTGAYCKADNHLNQLAPAPGDMTSTCCKESCEGQIFFNLINLCIDYKRNLPDDVPGGVKVSCVVDKGTLVHGAGRTASLTF